MQMRSRVREQTPGYKDKTISISQEKYEKMCNDISSLQHKVTAMAESLESIRQLATVRSLALKPGTLMAAMDLIRRRATKGLKRLNLDEKKL